MKIEVKRNLILKMPGRPKTYRQPLMVRVDEALVAKLERLRRKSGRKSVPSVVRWIIYKHFGEAHDQA